MAKAAKSKSSARKAGGKGVLPLVSWRKRAWRFLWRWSLRGGLAVVVLTGLWVALYAFLAPPTTAYILSERQRLGAVTREWVPVEEISPDLARATVAAEDANFCLHWGIDMAALRAAINEGGQRGASTISQQTVKNVFLWHGRSWLRKALEAAITPVMEAMWPKRRVLEVYLNVAEFGEGVFGAEAAAQAYFGVPARDLTLRQASLLAAALPSPQTRDPANPSDFLATRALAIADGAATIANDGRDACFAN